MLSLHFEICNFVMKLMCLECNREKIFIVPKSSRCREGFILGGLNFQVQHTTQRFAALNGFPRPRPNAAPGGCGIPGAARRWGRWSICPAAPPAAAAPRPPPPALGGRGSIFPIQNPLPRFGAERELWQRSWKDKSVKKTQNKIKYKTKYNL